MFVLDQCTPNERWCPGQFLFPDPPPAMTATKQPSSPRPGNSLLDLSVAPALPRLDQNASEMPLSQFVSLSLLMPGGARRRLLWSQTLLLRMCVCVLYAFPQRAGDG